MATGPRDDDEIASTVDVYFRMLTLELAGEGYSKAEFRREVERDVERSSAAIDYKFNNVSAVLDEIGAVWIPGYKPLRNVQQRLREVVTARFDEDADLRSFMLRAVEDDVATVSSLGPEVDPPRAEWPVARWRRHAVVGTDFAAIEAANRALWQAGETSLVEAERRRLAEGGREDLAIEVRHVSVVDGDGLGYDVRSFRGLTDEPVYVEVKTTRMGKEVPFFLSGNELEASQDHGPAYQLVRLYRFGRGDAGHYRLRGPLTSTAELRPVNYRGLPAPPAVG